MFEIQEAGQFSRWIRKLKDRKLRQVIINRIKMLSFGRFGDHKYLGDKISELRIHIDKGYRVYFSMQEERIIILLCGGDKSSQTRDIKKAKNILKNWCLDENNI